MKKVYSLKQYIKWKHSSALKAVKSFNRRKSRRKLYRKSFSILAKWTNYRPIKAPSDFRLTVNQTEVLNFFKAVRDKKSIYYKDQHYYVGLDLKDVTEIDYLSISVLKALMHDFKFNQVNIQGSSPKNLKCHEYLKDSGFYDGLLTMTNKPYREKGTSERIVFTKGTNDLSEREDLQIIRTLKKIRAHLTGIDGHCPQLRTIILEVCGNTIEHSQSLQKQWNLGVKYEKEKVIITLVDTGKGILGTLYRKFGKKFVDFVSRTDLQILEGAFDCKYGSRTKDVNRNKGLPSIKKRFDDGFITNLTVISNNVFLDFLDSKKSKHFVKSLGYDGTIFSLELDKNCFKS